MLKVVTPDFINCGKNSIIHKSLDA